MALFDSVYKHVSRISLNGTVLELIYSKAYNSSSTAVVAVYSVVSVKQSLITSLDELMMNDAFALFCCFPPHIFYSDLISILFMLVQHILNFRANH
jgi:hypothetical protein